MLKVPKRGNRKIHYLFYAKTITSQPSPRGCWRCLKSIATDWLTDLSSLLTTAKIQNWDVSGGLKQKNILCTTVSASGFELSVTNHTHCGPCPARGQAAKDSFGMFQCVFCCLFSEQPEGPKTWKHISNLHPCWGSGWVRSVILNLMSSSSSLAWVSSIGVGGVDSLQREQNWAKSEHSQSLELFCLWHWTTASPKSSISCSAPLPASAEVAFRCNFPLWLKVFIHVHVSGVKPSLTQQTLKYRLKPKPLFKWMNLGLELYFWMCLRFRSGYLKVKSLSEAFGGFPRRSVTTDTELKMLNVLWNLVLRPWKLAPAPHCRAMRMKEHRCQKVFVRAGLLNHLGTDTWNIQSPEQ